MKLGGNPFIEKNRELLADKGRLGEFHAVDATSNTVNYEGELRVCFCQREEHTVNYKGRSMEQTQPVFTQNGNHSLILLIWHHLSLNKRRMYKGANNYKHTLTIQCP
jgi:hypothetical protein